MLQNLEQTYLDLFFQLQKQQWENYANNAGHDLDQTNHAIYALLDAAQQQEQFQGRKAAVWQAIISKGKVENHPAVAALRNRLDNWDNYATETALIDWQEERLSLARNMRADVLELLELRQRLAQEQGFASYVDLALASENLSRATVLPLIEQYLHTNLPRAQALVQKYQISWSSWFSDLETLGRTTIKDNNKTELAASLLHKLGLSTLQKGLTIVSKPAGFAGYTGVLQPAGDVRILIDENASLSGLLILGHELGTAIAHLCNKNSGLFLTWTTSFDESMAVLLEQIAARLWLSPEQRQLARDIWTLEGVRCSLSFLFELALWEHPEQAEAHYLKHYSPLGLDLGDPAIWALDSFRSIDPVYIYSYVLGDVVAQRPLVRLESLYGANYRAWGAWLVEHYFALGREQSLPEKML